MSSFLFYTIIFITISVPVGIIIFEFFDIRFEVYGNYLLWFIAMAIFNAILPYKQISIFDDDILSKVKKSISNITTPASAPESAPAPIPTTSALPLNVSTTNTNTNTITNTTNKNNKNDSFSNLTPTKSKNNTKNNNIKGSIGKIIYKTLFGVGGLLN